MQAAQGLQQARLSAAMNSVCVCVCEEVCLCVCVYLRLWMCMQETHGRLQKARICWSGMRNPRSESKSSCFQCTLSSQIAKHHELTSANLFVGFAGHQRRVQA